MNSGLVRGKITYCKLYLLSQKMFIRLLALSSIMKIFPNRFLDLIGWRKGRKLKFLLSTLLIYIWVAIYGKQKPHMMKISYMAHKKNVLFYSKDHWQLILDHYIYNTPMVVMYHRLQTQYILFRVLQCPENHNKVSSM